MAEKFLRERKGNSSLADAIRQQDQLSYFLQSKIQEEINHTYLEEWSNRDSIGSDFFLNWVKAVFKVDNFLTFFKYFRHPIATTSLINDRIRDPLSRVFFAEDSFFNYSIRGEAVQEPEGLNPKKFNKDIFDRLLYRHNDIILTDLSDINKPFRQIIKIENVVALESSDSTIKKIGIRAVNESGQKGFLYVDNERYAFYDTNYKFVNEVFHDLGKCPANYIAAERFSDDDIVRKSIFSHSLEKFEEYVFLKTIQRMTEPNGAIPTVTMLETKEIDANNLEIHPQDSKEPMIANEIAGQKSDIQRQVQGKGNPLQVGTIAKVSAPKKNDGSLDMEAVTNFLNFFFIPTEALEYLNRRIKEIEQHIIVNILGDFTEVNEAAKNELQISKSYVSKQDKLRGFSKELTRIRNLADYDFLGLQFGADNVKVDCFYGSDFFIETENDLFDLFDKSPNPIERRNILLRLAQNRGKFKESSETRDYIFYTLIPYVSDKDFADAMSMGNIDPIIFTFQTRFNHWINMFEAVYGDIVVFWNSLDAENGEKIVLINNLIIDLINKEMPKQEAQQTA